MTNFTSSPIIESAMTSRLFEIASDYIPYETIDTCIAEMRDDIANIVDLDFDFADSEFDLAIDLALTILDRGFHIAD